VDKDLERQHLSEVFGKEIADTFAAGERPDFTLECADGVLGVETTSVFPSDAAAKLARDDRYAESLFQGTGQVHRRDLGSLDVLNGATLTIKGQDQLVNMVRYIVPPMKELIAVLIAQLTVKESKITAYLQRCSTVDLVVADDGPVFFLESPIAYAVLLNRFIPKRRILHSPFREIYLNTGAIEFPRVSAPLKGGFLFSDCQAYAELVGNVIEKFDLFCACLYHEGYTLAQPLRGYTLAQPLRGYRSRAIHFGSWTIGILKKNELIAQDVRLDLRAVRSPTIEQLVSRMDSSILVHALKLVDARRGRIMPRNLIFATHGEKSQPPADGKVRLTAVEMPDEAPRDSASLPIEPSD